MILRQMKLFLCLKQPVGKAILEQLFIQKIYQLPILSLKKRVLWWANILLKLRESGGSSGKRNIINN